MRKKLTDYTPEELEERQRKRENKPLTPIEEAAVYAYITGQSVSSVFDLFGLKYSTKGSKYSQAKKIIKKPHVQKRIKELMEEMKKSTIMTGEEVMEYFSAVTRGEIKDQFGLDAPLSERTAAAKEIAKRTIDVELKKQGVNDQKLEINLNWNRD